MSTTHKALQHYYWKQPKWYIKGIFIKLNRILRKEFESFKQFKELEKQQIQHKKQKLRNNEDKCKVTNQKIVEPIYYNHK